MPFVCASRSPLVFSSIEPYNCGRGFGLARVRYALFVVCAQKLARRRAASGAGPSVGGHAEQEALHVQRSGHSRHLQDPRRYHSHPTAIPLLLPPPITKFESTHRLLTAAMASCAQRTRSAVTSRATASGAPALTAAATAYTAKWARRPRGRTRGERFPLSSLTWRPTRKLLIALQLVCLCHWCVHVKRLVSAAGERSRRRALVDAA